MGGAVSAEAGHFGQTRRKRRRRRGPERSSAYLAWIRTLRCAVCLRPPSDYFRIEAAHTSILGPRGLGQRSSDFSAIPLCYWHHRGGQDSYHRLGERRFAEAHQVSLQELVATLNELHRDVTGRGPSGEVLRRKPGACGSSVPGAEERRVGAA